MSKEGEHLEFSYEPPPGADVLTVEGMRFSGQFFRAFARDIPMDVPMVFRKRGNGVVIIELWQGPAVQSNGQNLKP